MGATGEAEPAGDVSDGGLTVVGSGMSSLPSSLPSSPSSPAVSLPAAAPTLPAPSPATSPPLPSIAASATSPAQRRVVAIATDSVELLRPASDLARLLTSFGRADVLLVNEAVPTAVDDEDPDDWTQDGEVVDAVREAVGELGHPDLVVHRLGLTPPLRPEAEDELVAAMSELVGFDPEPLVYCLAPAEPLRGALARTAERIARVYGLPLLRYRCLELTLVDPLDPDQGAAC